jgi:uncharacterized protein
MKYFKQLIVIVGFSVASLAAAQGDSTEWFRAAATDDSSTILRQLLRGTNPNLKDPDGQPAIVLAARAENWKVVDALIAAPGIQLDARNQNDETALMMIAMRGNVPLAKRLIAKDADVNKPGWTPLHYAATGGNREMVQLMLEHHAYLDAASPNGTTPLMMAAMYGSPDAVKALLDAGADAKLKNALGMTALDFATQAKRPDAIQILSSLARQPALAPIPAPASPAVARPAVSAASSSASSSALRPASNSGAANVVANPAPKTAASAPKGMW